MQRTRLSTLALVAAGTLSGPVFASEEEGKCSPDRPDLCLNGVSASVTTLDALRVTGSQVTDSGRQSEADEGQADTVSVGNNLFAGSIFIDEKTTGLGVWGSVSYSSFDSDIAVAPYDANLVSFLMGLDKTLTDRFSIGLSVGYENLDTNTTFNGGGQDGDGWTLAPYATFIISDMFSIDASLGYSWLETDQTRIDPASVPGSPSFLTSSFDSTRWFATTNLNALATRGDWVLGGHLGLLYTEEGQDGYTETGGPSARTVRDRDVNLTQAWIGVDVARGFGAWEPYASLAYRYDLDREDGSGAGGLPSAVGSTQPGDDDEGEAGLGVRYFGSNGVSASAEWIHTLGREDFDNDAFSFLLRADF